WRLVRIRRSVRPTRPRPSATSRLSRLKDTVRRVLGPVAERVRGRLGVRVLNLPGRVLVLAESADALRSEVYRTRPSMGRRVVRVTIRVLWWRGPWRGWSGRIGPARHVLTERVSIPRGGRGPAIVDLRVEWPAPAGELLAAAERALRPLW